MVCLLSPTSSSRMSGSHVEHQRSPHADACALFGVLHQYAVDMRPASHYLRPKSNFTLHIRVTERCCMRAAPLNLSCQVPVRHGRMHARIQTHNCSKEGKPRTILPLHSQPCLAQSYWQLSQMSSQSFLLASVPSGLTTDLSRVLFVSQNHIRPLIWSPKKMHHIYPLCIKRIIWLHLSVSFAFLSFVWECVFSGTYGLMAAISVSLLILWLERKLDIAHLIRPCQHSLTAVSLSLSLALSLSHTYTHSQRGEKVKD